MPTILLLDTATDVLTVALANERGVLASRSSSEPREHAHCLLPWADELLQQHGVSRAGLDAVAFDRGPGSFTGLRIGCAAAQGIAYALGIPVIGVSSLELLAQAVWQQGDCAPGDRIVPVLDARMGECYWQVFTVTAGGVEALSPARVTAPHDCVPESTHGTVVIFAGAGMACLDSSVLAQWGHYRLAETVQQPEADAFAVVALAAFHEGRAVAAGQAVPLYVRDRVALTTEERAQGATL